MTHLLALLKTTGYPVAYHHFADPPKTPYVVYLRVFDNNINSDYKVHGKFKFYNIELYTHKKDPTAERKLEGILNNIDPAYSTTEVYLETEKLYMVVYEIKVIERG